MPQRGVQHQVRHDEPPPVVGQLSLRVDVELGRRRADRRQRDRPLGCQVGVGDHGEPGRERRQQRVRRDEPGPGALPRLPVDRPVGLEAELPCRKFDPDLWFSESPTDLELAKSLCGDCPLRVECLAGAVERAEPWGVWGGEIFERGAVVPRKRPRGRPRKEDIARDARLKAEKVTPRGKW